MATLAGEKRPFGGSGQAKRAIAPALLPQRNVGLLLEAEKGNVLPPAPCSPCSNPDHQRVIIDNQREIE
jgi:hypothetical protein